MAGAGVGMTFGPLAIQARFVQGDHRVAVVTGLSLFFRCLGGTIGLAQCATVLSSKVSSFLIAAMKSSVLPPSSIAALAHANADLTSIQAIDALPQDAQNLVRDAFRNGMRWVFISLIPWCGLAVLLTLFLSKIPDSDQAREATERGVSVNDHAGARDV